MVIFGLDLSHHQGTTIDFAAFRAEGVEFVFLKATQGGNFQDSQFATNLARAHAAGMLVAAYHYVESTASTSIQVDNVAQTVPWDVPIILDVETGSGSIVLVRSITAALTAAGYRVPLLYLPRWYWSQIGQPSLAGLPPLWSSRYPDSITGTLAEEYDDVPASYWSGYGGLDVAVLQFTSSARVAGRSPLDANAYRGTREQLSALLGYPEPSTDTTNNTEDGNMTTFWIRGDAAGEMGAAAPAGLEHTKWGDAVFHVDATADGLRRRHISAEEWAAVAANGAKVVQRPQTWVDSIPWGAQPGLFPWVLAAHTNTVTP